MVLKLNVTTEDSPRPSPAAEPAEVQRKPQGKNNKYRPAPHNGYKAGGDSETKKPMTGNLSSSLFTANPSVPTLPSEVIIDQEADVFDTDSFDTLDISPNLKGNLKTEFKCTKMTKVQNLAIPAILKKNDAQIKSATGSGKTLSYAVPVVHFLQSLKPDIGRTDGLYALVILPTRELVLQTFNVMSKLCRAHIRIVPGMLMGGEKKKSEKARLRKGVNILIGTPGRLADHLRSTTCLSFERTQFLVLDEADKLVEMGFMKDVSYIVSKVNQGKTFRHQTILLSATINKGVEDLKELSLVDEVYIDTGGDELKETFKIPDQLKQYFIILPTKLRLVTLATFLMDKRKKKVIVFLSCKDSVEFHYEVISVLFANHGNGEKVNMFRLHGSMDQCDRTPVYNKFSACTAGFLLTTDVAARGLDLPAVDWIVQYDCPGMIKDYVHRVGRTARAGRAGKALLLLSPHESKYIEMLKEKDILLKQVRYEKVLEKLSQIVPGKRQEDACTLLQSQVEGHCKEVETKGLAVRGFQSYVRSYATCQVKECFSIKELHLGHVAKTFGLVDAPSMFLHKNLSRKKQVEARKEHQYQKIEKVHKNFDAIDTGKGKKKKRKLNLLDDEEIRGLAVVSGRKPKKMKD